MVNVNDIPPEIRWELAARFLLQPGTKLQLSLQAGSG